MNFLNGKQGNPERISTILEKLEEVWKLYPDMRLGQLIVVCAGTDNIFGIEDEEMLEKIQAFGDSLKGAGLK